MFKYSLINRKQMVKFTSTHGHCSIPQKKDGDISKGKGRRWLGGKIYSIPCRASCFATVDLKEKDEFSLFSNGSRGNEIDRKLGRKEREIWAIRDCRQKKQIRNSVRVRLKKAKERDEVRDRGDGRMIMMRIEREIL